MELVCINCPVGCRLQVTLQDGQVIAVAGNQCKRGEKYARQECVDPRRVVTAVIPVQGCTTPLSVKTRAPIPKDKVFACMKELGTLKICAPILMGDVVKSNICGTEVDVIATKTVK